MTKSHIPNLCTSMDREHYTFYTSLLFDI